jgi:hypothetical protein
MVADPDVEYPDHAGQPDEADRIHAQGRRIKRMPGTWTDLFFPDVHGVRGS